jgi:hypothetical protein
MLLCESFIRSNATLPHRMSIIDSIKPLLCESKFFLPPNTNNHTRADAKKVLGIGRGTKHLGQFLECTKVSRRAAINASYLSWAERDETAHASLIRP